MLKVAWRVFLFRRSLIDSVMLVLVLQVTTGLPGASADGPDAYPMGPGKLSFVTRFQKQTLKYLSTTDADAFARKVLTFFTVSGCFLC